MVKFGKYHINALKLSVYFFLIVAVIIVSVDMIFYYLFDDFASDLSVHFAGHLIITLSVSAFVFFVLKRDFLSNMNFTEIIREEEKKYQMLFENANDAILLIKDHYIIDCNLKSCEIFNCRKNYLIGKSILELSTESQNVELLLKFILNAGLEPQRFEWKYNREDKVPFDAEVTLNQMDISGFLFIQVFIKDITELKNSQQAVSLSEEKFKMIFDSVSEGIIIFTENNEVLEVNAPVLKTYKTTKEGFKNLPQDNPFRSYLRHFVNIHFEEFENEESITMELDNIEVPGKKTSLEVRVKKIDYEGKKALIAVGRDISKRKKHEMAIFNAVVQAEERERSRMARELHDGVSPILSAAKLYAQSLRDCQKENLKYDILKKIESTIDESIQSISEISNNLSPHILQNFGLTAAVDSFIDKVKGLKSPEIHFTSNWEGRLEENLEVTIYRLVTELVNNSVKYAEAKAIFINIDKTLSIKLTYSDNGKGFNLKETLNMKKGMGLFNIINRVKSLNGSIDYFSEPGVGTRVVVEFKL